MITSRIASCLPRMGRAGMAAHCLAIASLVGLTLWGCATATSQGDTLTFTSEHGWSLAYPRDWKIMTRTDRSLVLRRQDWVIGVHTLPAQVTRDKSLDEIATFVLGQYPPGRYVAVARRPVTLRNGYAAIEVIHHIGTGVVGKSRKLITLVDGKAFLLDAETYLAAWDSAEPSFNGIIGTFAVRQ